MIYNSEVYEMDYQNNMMSHSNTF